MTTRGLICLPTLLLRALTVLVKKKNGETRVCIDYRQLNSLTVPDIYPLPLIEKLINEHPHACIFSKIDLKLAYNQIRIRKGDEKYTSIQTPKGNYEYLVMPFRMCDSPSAFQRIWIWHSNPC
jgi:Reverse transcriptase (RNA-dependent DNA polymerase)